MVKVSNSLDLLFPPFREQAELFVKKATNYNFFIYETYRSFETQMEYYKKGRELQNGIWVVVNQKDVVTKAKPGMSLHAYGLAFDAIPDGDLSKQGVQWSWNDTYLDKDKKQVKVDWKKVGSIGKSIGLEWAGDWKQFTEYPHYQNTYGFKVSELYPLLISSGIKSVWDKIEQKIPKTKNKETVNIELKEKQVEKQNVDVEKHNVTDIEIEKPIPVVSIDDLNSVSETEKKESILTLIIKLILSFFK